MAPHDHDDDVITDVLSNLDVDETNDRSDDERTVVRRVKSADISLPPEDEETIVRKALPRSFLNGPPPPGVQRPPPRASAGPPRPALPEADVDTAPHQRLDAPRPGPRTSSDSSIPAPGSTAPLGSAGSSVSNSAVRDRSPNPWPKRGSDDQADPSADQRAARSLELAARAGHEAPSNAETDLHDINDPPPGIAADVPEHLDTNEQLRRLGLSRSKPRRSYDPDTTGTGFYSLPPEEIESEQKPRSLQQLLVRGGLTATIAGIVATLAILATTATQWLAPGDTMLWATVALFPVAIVSILVCWPVRGESLGLRHAVGALGPSAVVGIIGLLFAGLWAADSVRASAVALAPDSVAIAQAQFDDESDMVFQAACARAVERHDAPRWRHALVRAMTSRPIAASQCLSGASKDAQVSLATSLVDRWHRHLMSSENETVCSYASALSMLPIERGERDARLLNCTLGAASPAVQTCCADVLSATVSDEAQWVARIGATIGYVRDDETATGLLAMSFHQQNLSTAQKRLADAVSFDGDGAQTVALEFACDAIESGNVGSTPHLAASLEGQCALDTAQIPTGRTIWSGICADALARIESKKEPRTVNALCEGARAVLTTEAIQTAAGLVVHAAQDNQASQLSHDIEVGFIRQRDQPQALGLDRIRLSKDRARRKAKAARGEFPDMPNF